MRVRELVREGRNEWFGEYGETAGKGIIYDEQRKKQAHAEADE